MLEVTKHALVIGGFVTVMMLIIEYLNVLTGGVWTEQLARRRYGQYLLAALMGAVPGCLGAFAVVTMYSHGIVSIGALAAAMVATSGDESFVMLAMMPRQAVLLFAVLFVIGVTVGVLTDAVVARLKLPRLARCLNLEVHRASQCECLVPAKLLSQWRDCSAPRGVMSVGLLALTVGLLAGELGPAEWDWVRITLLLVSVVALSIVATVPDHFLEEHLWRHVIRKHSLHVFLWTWAALAAIRLGTEVFHLNESMQDQGWVLLLVACLAGLIPESGPHLIFVTLFAEGMVPMSVLLANSIVQDGHGMLPLLAESRKAFLVVKAINLLAGFAVGAVLISAGH